MTEVFVIEQLWVDPLENAVQAAVGYNPVGWVHSEEEAIRLTETSKVLTKKDCWAIAFPMKEFRYRKLVKMKEHEKTNKEDSSS